MKRFALAMVFVFGVAAAGCDSGGGPSAPSAPSAPAGDASAPPPAPKALGGGGKKAATGAAPIGAQ